MASIILVSDTYQECVFGSLRRTSVGRSPESAPCRWHGASHRPSAQRAEGNGRNVIERLSLAEAFFAGNPLEGGVEDV
jgi:hypothetical protein